MLAQAELAQALEDALPPELKHQAAGLAQALVAAAASDGSAAAADPHYAAAVQALAGQRVRAGAALIDFGAGSQLGDVQIGDVAGGDLVKLQLTIAPTITAERLAVGRNIIQIGALVFPTWLVLALIGLLVLGAGGTAMAMRGPTRMAGTFNVAVADFAPEQAGNLATSAEGRRLSMLAFQALRQQQEIYVQENPADVISIWHDSLGWREKSVSIGAIHGESTAEREQAAQLTLERLNADMLIYGYLDPQGSVTLRFYVRPELQSEGPTSTIAGDYQVGEPVTPGGTRLTTRAAAIFWLIKGLQYDSEGRPDRSLAVLSRAETVLPDWRERGEGKELLALFQAQAALYQAQFVADQASFENWLAEAEAFVERAEARNPELVRTAVLAGNVDLLRAQCRLGAVGLPCREPAAADRLQAEELAAARTNIDAAITSYERAVSLGSRSPDWLWSEGVAPAALGFGYFLRAAVATYVGDDPSAREDYQRAIAAIEAALPVFRDAGATRLLAENYLALGTAYLRGGALIEAAQQRQAHFEAARQAFGACIALGKESSDEGITSRLVPVCIERERMALERL